MKDFDQNVRIIIEHLINNDYQQKTIRQHEKVLERLRVFLLDNELYYSNDVGSHWLDALKHENSSVHLLTFANRAIDKLNDVYQTGQVRLTNCTKCRPNYHELIDNFKNSVDSYIDFCNEKYADSYMRSIQARVIRFLFFVQNNGITDVKNIDSKIVELFHFDYPYNTSPEKHMCEAVVQQYLQYLADKKIITYYPGMLLYQLRCMPKVIIPDMDIDSVFFAEYPDDFISYEQFFEMAQQIFRQYDEAGYSKSIKSTVKRTLSLLYLCLAKNQLSYHPIIAELWFDSHIKGSVSKATLYPIKRAILLAQDYFYSGKISFERSYRDPCYQKKAFPKWCCEKIDRFLSFKAKEGKKKSTISQYRSACLRFCTFLDNNGIFGFSQLSSTLITDYCLFDKHLTPEAKNSCNSKIRAFLLFLAEEGVLENPMLYQAIPKVYSSKVKPVIVLSDEETEQIHDYGKNTDSAIQLRRRAMLLLGLRMGLRRSDIVALRIENIDWDKQTIRFIQTKTQVEIELPFPNDVGNAIFNYIINGRPATKTNILFVNSRAPYNALSPCCCNDALKDALPAHEKVGFHITRRTFATKLLNKGTSVSIISDALGHQEDRSIECYLSLDDKRMSLCPLSLSEEGILLKGGLIHE